MVWFVAALLFFAPSAGPAQKKAHAKPAARKPAAQKPTAPAVQNRWPIESLAVEGNHYYTPAQILAVAGLKNGQLAGKDEFEAARDRLVATGAFETVGYRFAPGANGKGYAASFQVTEVEPLYDWRVERLGVTNADVSAYLKPKFPLFGPKVPATGPALERYTAAIQEYLGTRKIQDKVIASVMPVEGERLVVVFRPERSAPAVAQVSFTGNQVIPGKVLQEAISDVAIGSAYNEDQFRQMLDATVRPRYEARGRIRVAFPKITVEKAKDIEGLHVTVAVDEGQTYDLGAVKIEGAAPAKPEELLKIAKFKTGDLANFDEINAGLDRIRKAIRRQGYLHTEAVAERKIDDGKHTVDLTIRINEGPRFTFGKLNIEGLDLHGEAAIKRMWTLKEGKPFNPEYPDYFLSQVREQGVFDNLKETKSLVQVDEQNHTADVTLRFH